MHQVLDTIETIKSNLPMEILFFGLLMFLGIVLLAFLFFYGAKGSFAAYEKMPKQEFVDEKSEASRFNLNIYKSGPVYNVMSFGINKDIILKEGESNTISYPTKTYSLKYKCISNNEFIFFRFWSPSWSDMFGHSYQFVPFIKSHATIVDNRVYIMSRMTRYGKRYQIIMGSFLPIAYIFSMLNAENASQIIFPMLFGVPLMLMFLYNLYLLPREFIPAGAKLIIEKYTA